MLDARDQPKLYGRHRLKVWAIALLSAPLLTITQPPIAAPWVGLFALCPLLIALPRLSAGGAWLATFLVTLPYFWVNMFWLSRMTTAPESEIYIFLMFAFIATGMPAYKGFCGMAIRWVMTRRVTGLIALIPLLWLGSEFVHEFNTPAPYPWLNLSTSMMSSDALLQIIDIVGAYGLTILFVFVQVAWIAPFELSGPDARLTISDRRWRRCGPLVGLAVLAGCWFYGQSRIATFANLERDDGPLIGCVQANIPQEVKVVSDGKSIRKAFDKQLRLTRECVDRGAELVCWAETMLFGGCTRDGFWRLYTENSAQYFSDGIPDAILLERQWTDDAGKPRRPVYVERLRALIAHQYKTPMLVGATTNVPESEWFDDWKDYDHRRYTTAIMFDAAGRVADSYDKRYMVPGGEYIPLESNAWVRGIVEAYATQLQGAPLRTDPGVRFTIFRLPSRTDRLGGRDWAFTSTICYEFAWPRCYVELHGQASPYPDFHVNISNEGWFKSSAELDQAVDFCRLRCIESRMPMIRATNTGITCVIDACGLVRDVLTVDGDDREVAGILLAQPPVLTTTGPTLFLTTVGRTLPFVSLAVLVLVFALMIVGRVQLRHVRKAARRASALEASIVAADSMKD